LTQRRCSFHGWWECIHRDGFYSLLPSSLNYKQCDNLFKWVALGWIMQRYHILEVKVSGMTLCCLCVIGFNAPETPRFFCSVDACCCCFSSCTRWWV
jgi:hypothetical protein